MISDAANTERPSSITACMFIGGALAARSVYTLQHLGITHILCLCSNEIGQSDSQYPDLFKYKNFSVSAYFCYCSFLKLKIEVHKFLYLHSFGSFTGSHALQLSMYYLKS